MKILVVDDNRSSAAAMSQILVKQGHEVTTSFDGQSAITHLSQTNFELVFTDLKMEPVDGMQVLRAARLRADPIEVIVFTAFGAVEHAVEAMRLGARDFLTKPISVEQILARVDELAGPSSKLSTAPTRPIQAQSEASRRLLQIMNAVADVPSPLWLEGELGSGRVHTAKWIHQLSSPNTEFAVVDPVQLDSFPFEGVCVLPGVDELSEADQWSLVRKLKAISDSVRVISTARPGARKRVDNGELRADLYFELAVVTVPIPPLRERVQDIVPMFEQALTEYCDRYSRTVPSLSIEYHQALQKHWWPGNIRELRNLAERTAVLGLEGFNLQTSGAPPPSSDHVLHPGFRLSAYLEEVEKKVLIDALHRAGGDRAEAGRILGVERNTLRYKLNKYELLQ